MKTLVWSIRQYRFDSNHDKLVRKLTPYYDFYEDGIALFARNFVNDKENKFFAIDYFKEGSLWYYIKNRKRLYQGHEDVWK